MGIFQRLKSLCGYIVLEKILTSHQICHQNCHKSWRKFKGIFTDAIKKIVDHRRLLCGGYNSLVQTGKSPVVNHGNGEILKVVIDYSEYHISCMHVFIQTWHVIIPISQTMCTLVKCFDILLEKKMN